MLTQREVEVAVPRRSKRDSRALVVRPKESRPPLVDFMEGVTFVQHIRGAVRRV